MDQGSKKKERQKENAICALSQTIVANITSGRSDCCGTAVLDELGVVAIFYLKVHGVSKEPVEEVERAETNHPLWKDHLGLSVKLDG